MLYQHVDKARWCLGCYKKAPRASRSPPMLMGLIQCEVNVEHNSNVVGAGQGRVSGRDYTQRCHAEIAVPRSFVATAANRWSQLFAYAHDAYNYPGKRVGKCFWSLWAAAKRRYAYRYPLHVLFRISRGEIPPMMTIMYRHAPQPSPMSTEETRFSTWNRRRWGPWRKSLPPKSLWKRLWSSRWIGHSRPRQHKRRKNLGTCPCGIRTLIQGECPVAIPCGAETTWTKANAESKWHRRESIKTKTVLPTGMLEVRMLHPPFAASLLHNLLHQLLHEGVQKQRKVQMRQRCPLLPPSPARYMLVNNSTEELESRRRAIAWQLTTLKHTAACSRSNCRLKSCHDMKVTCCSSKPKEG